MKKSRFLLVSTAIMIAVILLLNAINIFPDLNMSVEKRVAIQLGYLFVGFIILGIQTVITDPAISFYDMDRRSLLPYLLSGEVIISHLLMTGIGYQLMLFIIAGMILVATEIFMDHFSFYGTSSIKV